MFRFVVILLAVSLAGCVVGPDYQRPEVNAPSSFQYEERDAQDTANTDWWKAFQDPVLDCLIAESLANNLSVKIAAAHIEQAAALLAQMRSALFPQVGYSGSATRQRAALPGESPLLADVSGQRESYQLLAGASWEIDLWGRIRRLSEAARANVLATQEARRGVILSLVASVAETYIQLRGLDEQLDVARQTLASYAESVRLFELQFGHGQVSQMVVEQARSQYETAASMIPGLESQIAQTENALSILLGRHPGPVQRGRSVAELEMPAVPFGLPSQLLERRPDLAQAEQNLIAANAQIGAAKALYFPSISLTGAYGTQSSELSDLFKGPSRVWNYAGSVTGPIFTAGAIRGQVKQAQAAQEAARLGYQNAILSAFSDVENSLVARQKLGEQLRAQEQLARSLREYSRLAWLQYHEGYTPYLTVLNAESQLFSAELARVQTRTSHLRAFVRIYQAMGGGWVDGAGELTQTQQPDFDGRSSATTEPSGENP